MLRRILIAVGLFIFAVPMFGADAGAMLYIKGETRVNGGVIPNSSAIFPGDIVQTQTDSAANINAVGSNFVIAPDSILIVESNGVNLDRGGLTVVTSKGATVHVGNLTVMPAHSASTQFEISDTGGTIHIIARKGDITVTDDAGTVQLNEGQETTRTEDPHKNKDKALAGGKGPLIPAVAYEATGAGVAGALIVYYLSQDHTPASPIKP